MLLLLGQFCGECVEGYYRTVDNVVATCIQCECNGRANTCSTPTGICDCINSEGDRCENCSLGYFPDPIGSACLEGIYMKAIYLIALIHIMQRKLVMIAILKQVNVM